MSKISDIYDALVSGISTRLSGHKRLPFVYDLERNNEKFLEQGWAIKVLAMDVRKDVEYCNRMFFSRQFEIVVTRRYYSTSQSATDKSDAEKAILEDMQLLYAYLDKPGNISTDAKINDVNSDQGIQPLFVDEKPFYQLAAQFTVQYHENRE